MDQGEDIMMQTAAELRRHIRIVRVLTSALLRLLKPRRRLEDRRNGAQQNPVLDQAQNPDRAAQWAANEQEVARLQAGTTALAAGVDAAQRDVDGLQAQVDALQAQAGQGVGPAGQPMSRADELSMLTDEVRNQVAADPELSAQLAGLSQDEQNLVHSAVAGDMQVRLHGEEMVRRPDGSLMTRNEELQSITDDVRAQVAADPELSAQLAGLSEAEQDVAQRYAALGIQQELDRRFPDSRDPNRDKDHDLVPDDIENRHEAQDAAQLREAQDEEYRRYVDPDYDGRDNAVQDREAEQARRDQEAAQQKDQQRQQDLEEQKRTEQDAEAAGAAAGTAAAVDELDDRAEDLDEPETDQARQPELNEPDAEQVRLQEGLDGADPEQVRQQEGLDGADPEQVQGPRGPEVGQDGQGVGRDGASESVVGGHQQPGQDQPGQDQPGVGEPDGPGRQGQRTDALEDTLAQARADKGQGTVRVGSVSNSNINGLEIGDQGLPAGEYSEGERGGFDFKTTTPGGQEVRMHFEEGATVGGKKVTADEIAKLQQHQAGSPPAGSPRPEAKAESADAGQGARSGHALRAARPDRGGRGQEGSGPKPEGRG